MNWLGPLLRVLSIVGLLLAAVPAQAELIEEIIAWVNGDIITKSDYEEEEQANVADAYRKLTGDELDQRVKAIRSDLLLQLIDRKILVDKAERLYDMEKMGASFLKMMKEQQGIESDEEFERLVSQSGTTREAIQEQLIEIMAPQQVLDFEVRSRVAVSDAEIQTFYDATPDSFLVPAEATVREIVVKVEEGGPRDDARARAEAARGRLAAGEAFSTVASEVSEAPTRENGGLLGTFKKGELAEQLDAVAFSIEPGTTSELLEAPYGFHLLHVESRSEDHLTPLQEARENIRFYLEDRKYQAELRDFLVKARDQAEWCVKPAYQQLLSVPAPTTCEIH